MRRNDCFVVLNAFDELLSLNEEHLPIAPRRPNIPVFVNRHLSNIIFMTKGQSSRLSTFLLDYPQLTLICANKQVLMVDTSYGSHSLGTFDVILLLHFLRSLCMLVRYTKFPLRSFLFGEKLCIFDPIDQLRLQVPPPLSFSRLIALLPLLPLHIPLPEALLHGLVMHQMREGGPLALIVPQHLIEQRSDLPRALLQAEAVPYHLLARQRKTVNVVLESVSTRTHPVITVLQKFLQTRRTVRRGTREPPRPLIGPTGKAEISQFKLQPIIKNDDISRFDIPVDIPPLLEVRSKFDKLNNKSEYVLEVILVVPHLNELLKRSKAALQEQPDLIPLLATVATVGLLIIFEYLHEEMEYLDDALVLQRTQNLNLRHCLLPLTVIIGLDDLQRHLPAIHATTVHVDAPRVTLTHKGNRIVLLAQVTD